MSQGEIGIMTNRNRFVVQARRVWMYEINSATAHYLVMGIFIIGITLLLIALVILKSLSIIRFQEFPLFYSYSILLMVFQLSRMFSALLYKSHSKQVMEQQLSDNTVYEPTAAFVIPCKNEEGAIYENIVRCFGVDYPKEKLEVIVINDGSTDGSLREIRKARKEFPELKVIDWKVNRGKRHAMAAAIRLAKSDIIIQLDSDSYVNAKDFKKLLLPFVDHTISAVCAHADPSNKDENLLTKAQAAYYFMAFRILKAAESTFQIVLCCSGCCSAYRRSTILPLIYEFENEYFLGKQVTFGDDRSLTNLILKHGQKTIYVNDVQAYTIVPNNIRQLLKQQIRWKKSWLINTCKASRYIWKKDSFVAATYFYPLIIITLMAPVMAIFAIILYPLSHHGAPLYFLAGTLLVTLLFAVISGAVDKQNRHWFYLPIWAILNACLLTFILPYAILTVRNTKWGTR